MRGSAASFLIVLGAVLLLVGIAVQLGLLPGPLGRLPGDLRIERPGFSFYFPLTTSIVVSAVLSAVAWLYSRLS